MKQEYWIDYLCVMYAQVFTYEFTHRNNTAQQQEQQKNDELICLRVACELIHWMG